MTAPTRARGDFLPDAEFVEGLVGFGAVLSRGAALTESLAASADPELSPLPDDHPLLLALVGLVSLHRSATRRLDASPVLPTPPPAGDAEQADARGLLR